MPQALRAAKDYVMPGNDSPRSPDQQGPLPKHLATLTKLFNKREFANIPYSI